MLVCENLLGKSKKQGISNKFLMLDLMYLIAFFLNFKLHVALNLFE